MYSTIAFAATSSNKETVSFSAIDAISQASGAVQMVLLLLFSFSFFSWMIMFSKWRMFRAAFQKTEIFLDVFWSGKSLDSIYTESKKYRDCSIAKLFQAGYVELQRLLDKEKKTSDGKLTAPDSAVLNLERALRRSFRNENLKLERWLGFLATAGSTAPFIGLFGTVWGIMNAFQSIGTQGSANLATVAPGIAEALITTAIGLLCAIPAVMGYNYFVGKLKKMQVQLENFSSDFLNIVKRNFLS